MASKALEDSVNRASSRWFCVLSLTAHVGARFGISADAIAKAVEEVRGGQRVTSRNPEATYEALLKYGRDLTEEVS